MHLRLQYFTKWHLLWTWTYVLFSFIVKIPTYPDSANWIFNLPSSSDKGRVYTWRYASGLRPTDSRRSGMIGKYTIPYRFLSYTIHNKSEHILKSYICSATRRKYSNLSRQEILIYTRTYGAFQFTQLNIKSLQLRE